MAVEDKYTDANLVAGKKASALVTGPGADTMQAVSTVAIASGDDNGSVFRVFKGVPSSLVPVAITIHNTGITGGNDYDLGLYRVGVGGEAVDADVLADGISLTSARGIGTLNNVGMSQITLGDIQTFADLSGEAEPDSAYDIALTANTAGSANGTVRITATFAYI